MESNRKRNHGEGTRKNNGKKKRRTKDKKRQPQDLSPPLPEKQIVKWLDVSVNFTKAAHERRERLSQYAVTRRLLEPREAMVALTWLQTFVLTWIWVCVGVIVRGGEGKAIREFTAETKESKM